MKVTTLPGQLCFADFDRQGNEWMVRMESPTRTTEHAYVLYRRGVEVKRDRNLRTVNLEYRNHIADRGPDTEASMSR